MLIKPTVYFVKEYLLLIPILFVLLMGRSPIIQAEEKKPEKEVMLGTFLKFQRLYDSKAPISEKKKAIQNALKNIHSTGLNTVMPYVVGSSGRAYYSSKIIPEQIEKGWDPLEFVINEAPKYHLKVYPSVCVLVCGHHHLQGILKVHPEWALRNPAGEKLGFISSANEEARKWTVSVLKEITEKYQPDGLMLDYLRFNNRPMKLDEKSQTRFDNQNSKQDESEKKEAMQKFKEESLTALARMISEEVRPLKKGIQISIYSWGAHVSNNHQVAQNWKLWIKQNYIDMVCASGYVFEEKYGPEFLSIFQKRMEDAQKIRQEYSPSSQLTFCLGLSTSHGKVHHFREVENYLKVAAKAGLDGVVLFNWYVFENFREDVTEHHFFEEYAKSIQQHGSK